MCLPVRTQGPKVASVRHSTQSGVREAPIGDLRATDPARQGVSRVFDPPVLTENHRAPPRRPFASFASLALLATGALVTLFATAVFRAGEGRVKDRGLLDRTTGS